MKKIIALCLGILLILSGCHVQAILVDSVVYSGRDDLFVPISYSVPGLLYGASTDEIKDQKFFICDEDDCGRTLCKLCFTSKNPSCLWGEDGCVYCIVQQTTDDTTWFYENVCCFASKREQDCTEQISELKTVNDWGLPLNYEKMLALPYEDYCAVGEYDLQEASYKLLWQRRDAVTKMIRQLPDVDPTSTVGFDLVCSDSCGRILCSVVITNDNEKLVNGEAPVYLVMLENERIIDVMSLQNRWDPWEEIKQFKIVNHWGE